MFSITSFKNNVKIVRPNLFFAEVILPPTVAAAAGNNSFNNTFRFRCQATEFPGRTIATNDDISFGPTAKFGYDVTYNDLNLQIIASEDMAERKVFEIWMDNIITKSGTTTGFAGTGGFVRYYDDYARGKVIVYQVNDQRVQLAKCELNGAFPIGIGPMNLSWEEFDSYQRFAVTIAYRYHVNDFTQRTLSAIT
jgi:hypothetical protein